MGVQAIIERQIRDSGPLPFHRFMELALYHPSQGYYRSGRDPFGKRGDYYTNSQLQPVFGRLLAGQIKRWREQFGNPRTFRVFEPGAGRGETRREVRRCLPSLEWDCVDHGDPWPSVPLTGLVFCNEFFDALPVDVVERDVRGREWVEWGVGSREGRLAWERMGPSGPREGLPDLAPGRRIETCERQAAAMRRVLALLRRGIVAVVDYGYTRVEIERDGRFADGTLMSYTRHRADPDVLEEPGRRDITAHVNFSVLEDVAREEGAEVLPLRSQQAFLMDAGREDGFKAALEAPSEGRRLQLRMQLKTLLVGLGETFRVLLVRKP